ncbi:YkvA family protein [Segetibacter koreensis]|uniref:YkvA family protein n=1 Tax=Segetibacter koreensis TaxID=398037 RepID=UPI00036EDF50|nr:YkvA family protein [Segetibacter koreensis]
MQLLTKLKQRARQLKSESQVLMLAYKDKRTPFAAKILIGLTVGYLLSPIDLIPDFIPVLGLLDDLIIVPILISASIKLIPAIVLSDARQSLKVNAGITKKNNWFFAILIIIVWLLLIYFAYKRFVMKK